MRVVGLVIFLLLSHWNPVLGEEATFEKKCAAVVQNTGNTAEFTFPLPERQAWMWNMRTTKDNYPEYTWEVVLGDGVGTCEAELSFGVYLYKFAGSQETKGSIKQLLSEAQTSVWARSGDLRQDLAISSRIEGRKLILEITDKKTFSEILSEKPRNICCRVVTPYEDANYSSKDAIIFIK